MTLAIGGYWQLHHRCTEYGNVLFQTHFKQKRTHHIEFAEGLRSKCECLHGTLSYLKWTNIFDARRKGNNIHIVVLDLRDAFGSVPHEYILEAIKEIILPQELVEVISKSFIQSSTKFRIGAALSDDIMIRRGVKQWCPLSPLLFNICIEQLSRYTIKTTRISHRKLTMLQSNTHTQMIWYYSQMTSRTWIHC